MLTGEVKYFLSNRIPGEKGITLRWLLCVAFGRWSIERCFREAKDELGMDHFQVRGWRCLHRHYFVTQLSQLFCARVRQEYDHSTANHADELTIEQVRSAMNTWLQATGLEPAARREAYQTELDNHTYYQRRSEQARKSHTKTKTKRLSELGINIDNIKWCEPKHRDDKL